MNALVAQVPNTAQHTASAFQDLMACSADTNQPPAIKLDCCKTVATELRGYLDCMLALLTANVSAAAREDKPIR